MVATRNIPKWLGPGLILALALVSGAWAQSASRFDGEYVGELALTGIINGDCTKPPLGSAYPLSISGGVVRFKYVPRFDTTLVGRVDPNGSFKATARTKSGVVTMTGHVTGGNVKATLQSPSCMYSFRSRQ
jgi:hypothetical protein